MDTNKDIRWGIIGCGDVTEIKSGPAYQKTEGFQLTAVMRRNGKLAEDYAQRHGVEKHYSNADELINDDSIDAIYIATPPDSHKLYALRVAAVGKICCIEKPLAPSYKDSKEILAAFDKADVPLFVAYYRRSLPRYNKVKEILEKGEIGSIRHINWQLNKPASDLDLSSEYNWRTDGEIAIGGYFDDLASHGLDLFAYLLGEFDTVKGLGLNQQNLYSAFDSVSACWLHKNGVTGVGNWNFGSYSLLDKVTIYGTKGEVSFSLFDDAPISIVTLSGQQDIHIEHPENIQLHHVQKIRDQLLFGKKHPSTGTSATHVSWVMQQILTGKTLKE